MKSLHTLVSYGLLATLIAGSIACSRPTTSRSSARESRENHTNLSGQKATQDSDAWRQDLIEDLKSRKQNYASMSDADIRQNVKDKLVEGIILMAESNEPGATAMVDHLTILLGQVDEMNIEEFKAVEAAMLISMERTQDAVGLVQTFAADPLDRPQNSDLLLGKKGVPNEGTAQVADVRAETRSILSTRSVVPGFIQRRLDTHTQRKLEAAQKPYREKLEQHAELKAFGERYPTAKNLLQTELDNIQFLRKDAVKGRLTFLEQIKGVKATTPAIVTWFKLIRTDSVEMRVLEREINLEEPYRVVLQSKTMAALSENSEVVRGKIADELKNMKNHTDGDLNDRRNFLRKGDVLAWLKSVDVTPDEIAKIRAFPYIDSLNVKEVSELGRLNKDFKEKLDNELGTAMTLDNKILEQRSKFSAAIATHLKAKDARETNRALSNWLKAIGTAPSDVINIASAVTIAAYPVQVGDDIRFKSNEPNDEKLHHSKVETIFQNGSYKVTFKEKTHVVTPDKFVAKEFDRLYGFEVGMEVIYEGEVTKVRGVRSNGTVGLEKKAEDGTYFNRHISEVVPPVE